MGRWASCDYGQRRMGLAISDDNHRLALPLTTLHVTSPLDGVKQIALALKNYSIEGIVLGFPLQLNGQEGIRAEEVKKFQALLTAELPYPIILRDERLTSAQAEKELKSQGFKRKKRSELVDAMAAQIILQDYLDFLSLRS